MKEVLLGKTLKELQEVALSCGLKKFAGKQIAEWLYQKRAMTFMEMTNISLSGRQLLEERYDTGRRAPVAEAVSKDGTRKYLFEVSTSRGKEYVESVRNNLKVQLDNISIENEDGSIVNLGEKYGRK